MTVRIIVGNCLDELRKLPSDSVHCSVSSPPYWGLRDYGIDPSIWGGDDSCAHDFADEFVERRVSKGMGLEELGKRYRGGGKKHGKLVTLQIHRGTCLKCGAWRGALGLEPTPEMFVDNLVSIYEEVRRVLRPDGVAWVNMGDCYATGGGAGDQGWSGDRFERAHTQKFLGVNKGGRSNPENAGKNRRRVGSNRGQRGDANGGIPFAPMEQPNRSPICGLKAKDLVGVPWMLAFALRRAGWYLRQDIVWEKPNPMPESTEDRCTKAHEYLFLLAKGQYRRRTIKFADLEPETVHFGRHVGAQNTYLGTTKLCVELATAIFNGTQAEHDFSLPPFYAQEWKDGAENLAGNLVAGLPSEHLAATYAARLLNGDATTKEFLSELHRLRTDLGEGDHFLVGGRLTKRFLTPSVFVDGDATVAVNDAGEISEVDLLHGTIVSKKPSGCNYFYDAEAIKEDASDNSHPRRAAGGALSIGPKSVEHGNGIKANSSFRAAGGDLVAKRNKRSVWTVATRPFPGAHFATFPPELIEPCILAGTSARGACPTCRSPWTRVSAPTARYMKFLGRSYHDHEADDGAGMMQHRGENRQNALREEGGIVGKETETIGWYPTCDCERLERLPKYPAPPRKPEGQTKPDPIAVEGWRVACMAVTEVRRRMCEPAAALATVPCVVLDQFGGAGTTGLVAQRLKLEATLVEMNPGYAAMARARIDADLMAPEAAKRHMAKALKLERPFEAGTLFAIAAEATE